MSFFGGYKKAFAEYFETAVVGELEIVDAGHHTGQIIVWCIWRFAGTAHHREHRGETLEAYHDISL